MTRAGIACAAAATAAVFVLTGCVSPAPDEASFSDKAAMTAGAAATEVSTVRLATQLLLNGRIQRNYADVTISASEDALSSVTGTFSVVEPPDKSSDQVRSQMEQLLGNASAAVAAARIADRRDDRREMTQALVDLDKSARQLTAAGERYG